MKLRIANLGPIKQAEVDLRPLTIFIGPNNAGKTWTAYLIAALLERVPWYPKETFPKWPEGERKAAQIARRLREDGFAKIDTTELIRAEAQSYWRALGETSPKWLPYMIRSRLASFTETSVGFELVPRDIELACKEDAKRGQNNSTGAGGIHCERAGRENTTLLFSNRSREPAEKVEPKLVKDFILSVLAEVVHGAFCANLNLFPIERTTPSQILTSLLGPDPILGYEGPRLQVFSGAFRLFFRTMSRAKSVWNLGDPRFRELAEVLEREVLGGAVQFTPPPEDLGDLYEARFSYAKGRELEVQAASSMVRQLAPILLCLKGATMPGDWIVIDEPEMNLHPGAQAAVAEFLCLLVNNGFRVLVSTHSPYIVDHVASLIAVAKDSDKKALAEHLYLRRADAFVDREKVAISLFDKGTVKSILAKDGSVDWGTFSDVSEELRHIYQKILLRRKRI